MFRLGAKRRVVVVLLSLVTAGAGAPSITSSSVATWSASRAVADETLDGLDPSSAVAPGTELVQLRNETSQTFGEGEGRYRTEFYSHPVFYQSPGSPDWRPIALDFAAVPGADQAARVDEAPVALQVAPANDVRGFLTLEHGDRRISFHAPTTLAAGSAEPAVDGSRAEIADVLPGVDARIFAHAYGATSFLVLQRPPEVNAFTLAVSAPGLRLASKSNGSLAFVDGAGKTFATMPQPYAVDSSVDEHTGGGRTTHAVSYAVTTLDGLPAVTTTVDPAWLASATYPVYVDPSVTIYNEGTITYGDAHVSARSPDTNYANYQRPDYPYYDEMWLGENPSDATNVNEAYVKFDVRQLAGTSVDTARMEVRPYHQYYDAPTVRDAYLRRVTSLWYENEITWNTKPTYATAEADVAGACVEGEQCPFDVTAIAQKWASGTPNYGVRLHETGKDHSYWKRLISSEYGSSVRPRLIVTYHRPTATPTTAPDTWADSRTLTWEFSDGSGHAQSHYEVEIATDTAFTEPLASSGITADAAARSWEVPEEAGMQAGTTYHWRVRVMDGAAWSTWASAELLYAPGFYIEHAMKFRRHAGFQSDRVFVEAAEANDTGFPNRDFGVALSVVEAADMHARIDLQEAAAPAWDYALAQLETGGAYWDQPAGGVPVFAFVGDPNRHRSAIADRLPPGTTFRLQSVTYSLIQLQATQDAVDAAVPDLAREGIAVVSTTADAERNTVIIGVLDELQPSQHLHLLSLFGDRVSAQVEQEQQPDACRSRRACAPPPHRGGVAITPAVSVLLPCTAGFVGTKSGQTGHFLITAGHCFSKGAAKQAWYQKDDGGTWRNIGTQVDHRWYDNTTADVGWIKITAGTARNTIYAHDNAKGRAVTRLPRASEEDVGSWVCRGGSKTNFMCGRIYKRNATVYTPSSGSARDGTARRVQHANFVEFDAIPGDSGAPYFMDNIAFGIHSSSTPSPEGCEKECLHPDGVSWYSPLNWVWHEAKLWICTSSAC